MLRLTKKPDGAAITFHRPDGTATTSRARDNGYFARHDLLHYAVETTLGCRDAFIGLLARGHDIAEWEDANSSLRTDPPAEAMWVESLVGFVQMLWYSDGPDAVRAGADQLNAQLATHFAASPIDPPRISPARLHTIADRYSDLLTRWHALQPGQSLALPWPARETPTPRV